MSYLNKKQTANNHNNGSGEPSQQSSEEWILKQLKESAGDNWTDYNTINTMVKYAPDKVHAEFDTEGNLLILVGKGETKHKTTLGSHTKGTGGVIAETLLFGEATIAEEKTHKVYRYEKFYTAELYIIPLSKVSSFEDFEFKTFSKQIEVKTTKYMYKYSFDKESCEKCKSIKNSNKDKNLPKEYEYTTKMTSFAEFPRKFKNPIIDNYKERMHKAVNHLIKLHKNQSGDNTF